MTSRGLSRIAFAGAIVAGGTLFGAAGIAQTNIASAVSSSANSELNVNLNPMIAISVPTALNLAGTPTAAGSELITASGDISVTTNNSTGYKLTLSMKTGATTNALVNTTSSSATIPTLSGTTTVANFPVNQWGYSLDYTASSNSNATGNFNPLPTVGGVSTLKTTTAPAMTDTTAFTVGTRVDTSVMSGTYNNTLTFTAVTNDPPKVVTTFDMAYAAAGKTKDTTTNLYKFQDMNTSICSAVTAPESSTSGDEQTTTLVDTRDGKTYSVGKLADGNCWMQENLRLGSETDSYSLTENDTNLPSGSTFTLPAMSTSTSWTSTYTSPMLYPSDDQNTDSTKGALGYYGYYYNYNAASAGTDTGTSTTELTSDICPKGWSLPSNYTVNPDRSYSKLLYAYGVIDDITTTGGSYPTGGWDKMQTTPLKFVLSGVYYGGVPVYRANLGYYWSSSSRDSTYAYLLYFNSFYVSPQYDFDKSFGIVIRCLAKTGDNPTPTPSNTTSTSTSSSSGSSSGTSGSSTSGGTTDNSSADPLGVKKSVLDAESSYEENSNMIPALISLAVATVAGIGLVLVLARNKRDDDEDDAATDSNTGCQNTE